MNCGLSFVSLKECQTVDDVFDPLFKYLIKNEFLPEYYMRRLSDLSTIMKRRKLITTTTTPIIAIVINLPPAVLLVVTRLAA